MKADNVSPKINESPVVDYSETIFDLTSARKVVHGEVESAGAGILVRRLSDGPRREIEGLIEKLETFLEKLETEGVRIQADIEEYAERNQRAIQLTTIVADSVKKLPEPCVG
jgi:molecular chaperone GrpE (heat shock protein)